MDFDESWNFTDVLQANQTLNIVSTAINTAGLSPYEKYLAVYSFINNFAYKAENDNEPISTSRRIVPVLVGDSIVCAGFTQLFMALCDRVGLPNLSTSVARQSRGDYHIMNVIKIQDEKYGIDGIYEVDATFDTRSKNTSSIINKKYINHLLPVGNYTRTHRYIPDNPTFPNPVGKAIIQPHILKSDPVKFDIKVETSFNLTELQVYKFLENKGLIEGKIITQSDALQDSNTALEQLKEQGLSQQEIDKAMTAIIDNKLRSAKKINYQSVSKFHKTIRNSQPISNTTFKRALATVLYNIDYSLFVTPADNLDISKNYNNSSLDQQSCIDIVNQISEYNVRHIKTNCIDEQEIVSNSPFASSLSHNDNHINSPT